MILYIQNMVCDRCIRWVNAELNRLNIPHGEVHLAWVEIYIELTPEQVKELQDCLEQCKLKLIRRKALITVESIKHAIYDMINTEKVSTQNTSDYLSNNCKANYNYLSNVFKQETGETIINFYNKMKIAKAKELISYGEHNLTDIAYILHYSSVAYFSSQFKKFTGMTPSAYRQSLQQERDGMENL